MTFKENIMCEYCDLKPSANAMVKIGRCFDNLEYEGEMYITQFEDGEYVLTYYDNQIGEENYAPIKFCPICGKNLYGEN